MLDENYTPRVIDSELRYVLESSGAVVIEGPKDVGKTSTALRHAQSISRLDIDPEANLAAHVNPRTILEGEAPHLVDEWQLVPSIWNHVRHEVDRRRLPGQFILTGSSTPDPDETRHTGAGRFSFVRMRPMSLFETEHSTGQVSLTQLLSSDMPSAIRVDASSLEMVAERAVIGGWPRAQALNIERAIRYSIDYLRMMQVADVSRAAGKRTDPKLVRQLFQSLARNIATEVSANTLATDSDLSKHTVIDYLDAFERLMIVEHQPAWGAHLRSKTRLRKQPKRHFIDPSLAAAALRVTPKRLMRDLQFFGFLFESLVIRDLRIYAPYGAEVFHYRDERGYEVDAIVDAGDGRYAAFEVKLGGQKAIDEGAQSLKRFAARLKDPPQALGVIVATSNYAVTRPDGVMIIPITALGP